MRSQEPMSDELNNFTTKPHLIHTRTNLYMSDYTEIENYNFTSNKLSQKAVLAKRIHYSNDIVGKIKSMTKQSHFNNNIVRKNKNMTKQSHFGDFVKNRFLMARKKLKTEKRTHFAVFKNNSTIYREFLKMYKNKNNIHQWWPISL